MELSEEKRKEAEDSFKGKSENIGEEDLLDAYYGYRGWDKDGVPTPEKLTELGLENYIDKM